MATRDISDFVDFEAKVQHIMEVLEGRADDEEPLPEERRQTNFENIDVDNVRLKVRENRTVINKNADDNKTGANNMQTTDVATFMRDVERDANERAEDRAKCESEAQKHRSQGNEAFRKSNYEKAILHYTKSLERIKKSAITYNNRALCYIKLNNYKRALEDCGYVLEKLDESNLRAWLYSATAYKRLNDKSKFKASIESARQCNPNQVAYIEKFIQQMDLTM
ncbi:tetratricopeptide repeat protein 12 [Scaptodrosophila lebanonensis]|uniref:Tetratricopeptide repeat protein 12 n=1 Tax=Drosophila lebanonensis TaxID=7225 RepID=A0A6J2T486_DROLE|nr:tetratricopeptide repeat protein 12 [Scaptodrosophila lebanonensis]